MLNKSVLIGRLTKDPEVKTISTGSTTASFTLAVDRSFKDKNGDRGTDFIPIVAWGKTAELVGQYLSKGRQTAVSGRIQTRTYEAQDGTRRYVTEVIAEEVTFLGSRNDIQQEEPKEVQVNLYEEDDDAPF